MPLIRYFESGSPREVVRLRQSGIVEVVLDDGRTAQMIFRTDGQLTIRAWGNIPAKIGNANMTGMYTTVEFEKPTTCEVCYNRLGNCGCKPL